jgi:hypothetical protein
VFTRICGFICFLGACIFIVCPSFYVCLFLFFSSNPLSPERPSIVE